MKQKTLSPKAFLLTAFFLTAALTYEQIFVYLRYYDFEKGLWLHSTPDLIKGLVYITLALIALFAVAYISTSPGGKKQTMTPVDPESTPVRIVSLLGASTLVATLVVQLAAIGSFDHLYLLLVSESSEYLAIAAFLHRATLIFAPFACLWFVQLVRGKKPSVLLSLFPIIYLMFLTLRVYFDMNTLLSDPRWSFRVVTLLFAMLFMLMEIRLLVQPKNTVAYRLIAVPAMCILGTSGVSNLVFNITGHFSDGIENAYYVLELVLAIYIAVRFYALVQEGEKKEEAATLPSVDEITLPEEEPVEESGEAENAEEVAPEAEVAAMAEEDLDDLTEDEVKRFYKAVTNSVRNRMSLSNPPTPEEENAVKEESLSIIVAVLRTENRNDRITAVRTFLAKTEKNTEA